MLMEFMQGGTMIKESLSGFDVARHLKVSECSVPKFTSSLSQILKLPSSCEWIIRYRDPDTMEAGGTIWRQTGQNEHNINDN